MQKNYLRIESFPHGKPSSIRVIDISHVNGGCMATTGQLAEAGVIPASNWKQISDDLWNPVRETKSGRTWLRQFLCTDDQAAALVATYLPKI